MRHVIFALFLPVAAHAGVREESATGFMVEHELVIADTPEAVFDAFTGDVSGWWDHHFSEHPKALYIEPKPGGGFFEVFDDAGNGARHAVVIGVEHGEMLRFEGPMGLAGFAINMVHTVTFEQDEGGTKLSLVVDAFGRVQDGWARAVDETWHHFLYEQFAPYVAAGRHRAPGEVSPTADSE